MPVSRRRATLAAALVATSLGTVVAGCASVLGPRSVEVSQAQLQAWVERQFPADNPWLRMLDLVVAPPRVDLRPAENRLATTLDVTFGQRLLRTPYRGTVVFTNGLRYEPADRTLRLVDVRIERAELGAAPGLVKRELDRAAAGVVEALLRDPVVYRLRPEEVERFEGRGYQPGPIDVTLGGVRIEFVPRS